MKNKNSKDIIKIEPEEGEAMFMVSFDEDMKSIMVVIKSNEPMTPTDFVDAMAAFVDDVSEFPEKLFVEAADIESTTH